MQSLLWATAHCSTFVRHTKPNAQANLAKELQSPTHGKQSYNSASQNTPCPPITRYLLCFVSYIEFS
ncbi:MAG: hypothetical protein Q8K92_27565 [Leadbetterella sp.]|nr:hypothetical protein [Leadbetterella sp.]